MLSLPNEDAEGEDRRVPFQWTNNLIYIRQWRALDHGLFLVEYTNARNGKSRSWKWAIIKEGLSESWGSQPQQPIWREVATARRATIHGQDGYRVTVWSRDEQDAPWAWRAVAPCRDYEQARDWMLGITEVMYGVTFARA